MRKAINFFRSYYDVAKELKDKDRLKFYDALLSKQFDNIDIELDGMAKFAYLSQKHSIDSQVKGYFDKTKDEKFNPTAPPCLPPTEPPTVQEKEEEKGKEKEEVEYTTHPMVSWLNETCPKVQKLKNPITDKQAETILNEFSRDCIRDIFSAMQNDKKLNSKYEDANLTFRNWVNVRRKTNPNYGMKISENKINFVWNQ
jgi:hypothetical protein